MDDKDNTENDRDASEFMKKALDAAKTTRRESIAEAIHDLVPIINTANQTLRDRVKWDPKEGQYVDAFRDAFLKEMEKIESCNNERVRKPMEALCDTFAIWTVLSKSYRVEKQ